MNSIRLLILVQFFLPSISACSLFPEPEAQEVYILPVSTIHINNPPEVFGSIQIGTPSSSSALDSNKIAVIPFPNQIRGYKGVRWSDRATVLLRDRLVVAFTRGLPNLNSTSSETPVKSEYQLEGELRAFQSEYIKDHPVIHIQYYANLIKSATQEVVSSKEFDTKERSSGASIPSIVEAFGHAGDRLAKNVVEWTSHEIFMQNPKTTNERR